MVKHINIYPSERGVLAWFNSLSYRDKLYIYKYFKDGFQND